jgi:hypothetical protein
MLRRRRLETLTVQPATAPLFDRLPAELFRPLAAANNRRYWDLLCRLLGEVWGDGGRSPGEEAPKQVVIRVIESLLVASDPWEEELETSTTVRAHTYYNVLRDCGWLSQRRRGLVDVVTVRPVVAQFFTVLCDFAEHEPEFIGSKVASIYFSLRAVESGEAGGNQYAEAAQQAKRCMAHIANTGCRVQDLMEELVKRTNARDFVRGFFEEYVEKVFIADYSELRTRNHPLQHRTAIVTLTLEFMHNAAKRARVVDWYSEKRTKGDRIKAEALFERDTQLLLRLQTVEEQLQRLDDEIRVANQRALAFIEYKLRAPRNFDRLIQRAIEAAGALPEQHLALPAAGSVDHASEHGLAKPRNASRDIVATALERREPTPEELAMEMLRQQMVSNRNVRPTDLAEYVSRHLIGREHVTSDQLQIESIKDLCCYQRLLLIASRYAAPPDLRRSDPHVQMIRRMKVAPVEGEITRNDYMEHPRFQISVGAS